MGRALYRKYRSKKLSEIVGQEHVTTALSNALKNGTISHAYLFTGPRGTGKTSIARILAHEVNGLPYDENATHLDIIEIDAASNRRIDEIRTLRERVHNAPTSAKYKVYIIDEVHMLTKEAFNALLKTLEEPPEHVIFVLATTEAHKLPETIISRTQRYTFKPATIEDTVQHLRTIAQQEDMQISDEALLQIATHGNGSFRDSISLLDQVGNSGEKIEETDVLRSLGIAPATAIIELIETINQKDTAEVITKLEAMIAQGYQPPQLSKQITSRLRASILSGEAFSFDTPALMAKLINVPAAHDPKALLEIVLLEPTLDTTKQAAVSPAPVKAQPEPTPKQEPKPEPTPEPQAPKPEPEKPRAPPPPASKAKAGDTVLDEANWQQILHTLKQQHNTLHAVARMAAPVFEQNKLTLNFAFPFHYRQMNDSKNKLILGSIIEKELGYSVEIVCILDKGASPKKLDAKTEAQTDTTVDTISTIFGGAELLE
jgi:DNA polymerase III subunit gamma/tau